MNTILIIEDEKILRETLTDILEINGYNVLQAKDGEEGVEIYTQTAPDLIICDINMPKMNGFEVLHMLEVIMPVSQFPPFIFQSAKTEPENIRKGMNLGATDFITKPYSAPELLKVSCISFFFLIIFKETVFAFACFSAFSIISLTIRQI